MVVLILREDGTMSLSLLNQDPSVKIIRRVSKPSSALHVKESSTGSVQTKYRVKWKTGKKDTNLEKTLLFCTHLDHLQLGKFANFLTKCDINFHCNARSTFVIDVDGIDASVLVRLMHYAEIPIPTTEVQGAFSLTIRQVGVCTFNRTLIDFRLSFRRIGALPSYPLQIRSKELKGLISFPLGQSTIAWLKSEMSGFNLQNLHQ